MENRRLVLFGGLGCAVLVLIGAVAVGALLLLPLPVQVGRMLQEEEAPTISVSEVTREVAEAVPTLTPFAEATAEPDSSDNPLMAPSEALLNALYAKVSPGVVNIRVYVEQGGMTGQGAGSGFVIDDEGHIVTNNHVVAPAEVVTVIFYDGFEARAEIVGTDADSDLAVLEVDTVPEGVQPLRLGVSDEVMPGDWVVAIGNPFRFGGSMTVGIVSAIGRTIPTEDTPFSIPQAVQTDAAINPGNSGGPLLDLDGNVVGVNAQIASSSGANSGVGFAIPADVVRRVTPELIERGRYAWPWLGVRGGPVTLALQRANDLDTQEGAYIHAVIENSPADQAGLQGSSGERTVFGQGMFVGGDVVVEADGQPIQDFADLLTLVAFKRPGDTVTLTILRDGSRQEVPVDLAARP